MNKRCWEFIGILSELLNDGYSVGMCLKIMCGMESVNKKIKNAAVEIYKFLNEGYGLTSCFLKCTSIEFSKDEIVFFRIAEECGNIKEVLNYLNERNMRNKKVFEKTFMAMVYPLFVILLCVVFGLFILFNGEKLFMFSGLGNGNIKSVIAGGFYSANSFLLCCVFLFVLMFCILFGNKSEIDFFYGIKFLVNEGFDFYSAVKIGHSICKKNSLFERKIIGAIKLCEKGENVATVIKSFGKKYSVWTECNLYSGKIMDGMKTICNKYEAAMSVREKIYGQLIESSFVLICGTYIVLLLKDVISMLLFQVEILGV